MPSTAASTAIRKGTSCPDEIDVLSTTYLLSYRSGSAFRASFSGYDGNNPVLQIKIRDQDLPSRAEKSSRGEHKKFLRA
jgi:hypothetical protein